MAENKKAAENIRFQTARFANRLRSSTNRFENCPAKSTNEIAAPTLWGLCHFRNGATELALTNFGVPGG